MRTDGKRRPEKSCPRLETLESRVPPGDMLGVLLGGSLLGPALSIAGPEPDLVPPDGTAQLTPLPALTAGSVAEATPSAGVLSSPTPGPREVLASQPAPDQGSPLEPPSGRSLNDFSLPSTGQSFFLPPAVPAVTGGTGPVADFAQAAPAGAMSDPPAFAALSTGQPPVASPVVPTSSSAFATPSRASQVANQLAQLPLTFEANHGQAHPSVQLLSHSNGSTLLLSATQAVLNVRPADGSSASPAAALLRLAGSNPAATPVGQDQLAKPVNYYYGSDPSQWHANVATFGQVEFQNVYLGIFDGNNFDMGIGIALGAAGTGYICRGTSLDFPITPGAFQTTLPFGHGSHPTGFVAAAHTV